MNHIVIYMDSRCPRICRTCGEHLSGLHIYTSSRNYSRLCSMGHEQYRHIVVYIGSREYATKFVVKGPDYRAHLIKKILRETCDVQFNPKDIPEDLKHGMTIHIKLIRQALAPLMKSKRTSFRLGLLYWFRRDVAIS